MTDTTRTQGRHAILADWPWLGFASDADSIGSGDPAYIVDRSEFQHEREGPNELAERYVHRYNRTGYDRVRRSTDLDTENGYLYVDGDAYTNTNDTAYEVLAIHPDEIIHAMQDGQKKQVDRQFWALSLGKDGNMERADVDYWDGTSGGSAASNATPTKVTDEEYVYQGPQALKIAVTAAGGYVRSQLYRITPGKLTDVGFIGRVDGTMTFKVYDATNGVYLTSGRSYAGEDFVAMFERVTPPAGDANGSGACYEIQLEWSGAANGENIYVSNILGPYPHERRQFELPAEYAEGYNVKGVRTVRYLGQIRSEIYDAYSREWTGQLLPTVDYQVESFHRSANPYHLAFTGPFEDEWFYYGIWAVAERPLSEVEPLDTEGASTSVPLEQAKKYWMASIAEIIRDRNPDDEWAQQKYQETRFEEAVETLARPPVSATVQKRGRVRLRA